MAFSNVQNRNFQSPLNFNFIIDRLKDFDFYVQSVNLPAITLPNFESPTPFSALRIHGDHIQFSNLEVTFKIAEGMYNWYEIFSWMQALGFPERQKQFGDLRTGRLKDLNDEVQIRDTNRDVGELYGQATLLVNSSHNNPYLSVNFVDVHPVNLSDLEFVTTDSDVEYLTSTVSFAYDYYTVEKIE